MVGTYGQGLCRYNDETDDFTRYDYLKLPNKIITSIIPKGDLLWISTNKGLAVYNPDTEYLKPIRNQTDYTMNNSHHVQALNLLTVDYFWVRQTVSVISSRKT